MKRFIIVMVLPSGDTRYLCHEGCKQRWTSDVTLAMVYTRMDVAEGLMGMYGGVIQEAMPGL